MTAIKPRYEVRPWQLDGITFHCVWDTQSDQPIFRTGAYYTERYAQEDADKLNVAEEGGETH